MAVSANRQLMDGSNIMLFSYTSSGYKSVAHASSHTLSISTEQEEINTKDAGAASWVTASRYNWEITCDHFYTSEGYEKFLDLITNPANNQMKVAFGLKSATEIAGTPKDVNKDSDGEWNPNTSYVYYGTVTVSNLDWTAAAGSKSTFSATLNGVGAISKTTPSA